MTPNTPAFPHVPIWVWAAFTAFILAFVGVKMLAHGVYKMPEWLLLVVILGALVFAVALSLLRPLKTPQEEDADNLSVR